MTRHQGMRSYYEARASEYDDWWNGTGLFEQRDRPGWHEEVAELVGVLKRLPPKRTLDVACGTGFLTRHLPGDVTGLDQSESMAAVARTRVPDVVTGDALDLAALTEPFERLFTSHFYGHLQPDERTTFLEQAAQTAQELVVCDSAGPDEEDWQERTLNDGSTHRVYKRWFRGSTLAAELGGGEVLHEGRWFVVASTFGHR